jgi:hypothetical protein
MVMQMSTRVDSQTRTKLTAAEVIALGLVGLLALVAFCSLLLVLAFI